MPNIWLFIFEETSVLKDKNEVGFRDVSKVGNEVGFRDVSKVGSHDRGTCYF